MANTTRNRRFTVAGAIAAHAAANASDPFAAKRVSLHLSKGHTNAKHVTETAERVTEAHTKRTKRNGVADWISEQQAAYLTGMRNGLLAALKKRPAPRRKPLKMRNVLAGQVAA